MRIRAARIADRLSCERLYVRMQREISGEEAAPGEFDLETRGETIWVAEGDGRVAGFASLSFDPPFLHLLMVDPQRRGERIGWALIEGLARDLRRPIELKCRTDNKPALAFYAAIGAVRLQRVDDAPAPFVRLRLEPARLHPPPARLRRPAERLA